MKNHIHVIINLKYWEAMKFTANISFPKFCFSFAYFNFILQEKKNTVIYFPWSDKLTWLIFEKMSATSPGRMSLSLSSMQSSASNSNNHTSVFFWSQRWNFSMQHRIFVAQIINSWDLINYFLLLHLEHPEMKLRMWWWIQWLRINTLWGRFLDAYWVLIVLSIMTFAPSMQIQQSK